MGVTLLKVDEPDRIEVVKLDLRKLHREDYRKVGYKSRRVFDIDISGIVTEYQAEILEDSKGNQFIAPFPKGVTKAVRYGTRLKAYSVYMSQFN